MRKSRREFSKLASIASIVPLASGISAAKSKNTGDKDELQEELQRIFEKYGTETQIRTEEIGSGENGNKEQYWLFVDISKSGRQDSGDNDEKSQGERLALKVESPELNGDGNNSRNNINTVHYKPNPGHSSENIADEVSDFEYSKYNMTPTEDELNAIEDTMERNRETMERQMESEWEGK